MKKLLIAILAVLLLFAVTACSGDKSSNDDTTANQDTLPFGDVTFPSGEVTTNNQAVTTPAAVVTTAPEPEVLAANRTFESADDIVFVITGAANLRTDTSMVDSVIYKSVDKGTELKRTGYSDDWYRVEYEGKTYYVKSSVVTLKVEETTYTESFKVYITTGTLKVRSSPDFNNDSNIVGYLKEGDQVEVVASGDGWYKIYFENEYVKKDLYYIGSKYTSKTKPATTAAETTAPVTPPVTTAP